MNRDEVIAAMKSGARLHMAHSENGHVYWLDCAMLPVRQDVGDRIIRDPSVVGTGDHLIPDTLSQTYLYEGGQG